MKTPNRNDLVAQAPSDKALPAATLTRAEVKSAVLQARAAHQLVPAGEGVSDKPDWIVSAVPRSTVKSEVLAARASGQLVPAGEGYLRVGPEPLTSSTLARSELKAEVIAARRAGELVPAGEGPIDTRPTARVAETARPLATLVGGIKHAFNTAGQ